LRGSVVVKDAPGENGCPGDATLAVDPATIVRGVVAERATEKLICNAVRDDQAGVVAVSDVAVCPGCRAEFEGCSAFCSELDIKGCPGEVGT
jgi:hypothetical protein